jgi:glycosyltransferase involved in cell wall biosynthesis
MTRLVFVTQQVDAEHPVLATAVPKIRALAARVDAVEVLALRAVPGTLPANCSVKTFAAPSKAARTARYVAALAPALRRRPLALVVHSSPVYAVLAAPLARPLRVPVLLWFTQAHGGRLLHVAARTANAILSVDARSVPLASRKVRAIGHGIDVDAIPCAPPRPPDGRLRLLGLGRYNPVKGWDVAVRALAELPDAELVVHGSAERAVDARNRASLERLAAELGVADRVELGEAVPRSRVPELLAGCDALVNPTRGSSADKVVFEAAAACRAAFASSPVFDAFLPEELRFTTAEELAARLRSFDPADDRLGRELRARVEAEHSVERWADAVLAEARR